MKIKKGEIEIKDFYDIDADNCSHEGIEIYRNGKFLMALDGISTSRLEDLTDEELVEWLFENDII